MPFVGLTPTVAVRYLTFNRSFLVAPAVVQRRPEADQSRRPARSFLQSSAVARDHRDAVSHRRFQSSSHCTIGKLPGLLSAGSVL